MSRQNIAAGNWKMNKTYDEALALTRAIIDQERPSDVLTIIGCPYPYLKPLVDMTQYEEGVEIASQNCHQEDSGAYTGEVSVPMLDSMGVKYVIIGHSERRQYFNESDELLAKKVDKVLSNDMTAIFCCGEPLEIRKAGNHIEHVKSQITNSLFHLSGEQMKNIILAYEPIWAIGTGETASPEQAQEMHAEIRTMIRERFGNEIADGISILYGGSVKPGNAKELFGQEDVDGGLVGGASMDAESFGKIIHSF